MARPRQVTDEQILATLRKLVLSQGPNVSLERVAKPLEVTVPALLKRFGSRQAMMLAALKPPDRPEWILYADRGPDDRPLEVQLRDLMSRIAEFVDKAIPCMSALRESGIPPNLIFSKSTGPAEALRALQQWLKRARKAGLVTAPETDSAAFAILGALQSRVLFSHLMKRPVSQRERHTYIQELSRLFTKALTT